MIEIPEYSPRLRHTSWQATLSVTIELVARSLNKKRGDVEYGDLVSFKVFNSIASRREVRSKLTNLNWNNDLTIGQFVKHIWPKAKLESIHNKKTETKRVKKRKK